MTSVAEKPRNQEISLHISGASPHRADQGLATVDSAGLASEICSLAAHITVATARLILLLGEFDAREAWSGFGLKSCAHWLSWQCHLGTHTAREHVRVARALRSLPLMTAEFAAGRLSYSKIRGLTRIADSDCEANLVALALNATAAQIERTVQGWRRADADGVDQEARRQLRWYFDSDGMLVLNARLNADEGALLLAAMRELQGRQDMATPRVGRDKASAPEGAIEPYEGSDPEGAADPEGTADPHGAPIDQFDSPAQVPRQARPHIPELDALVGLATSYLNEDGDVLRHPDTQLVVHLDAGTLNRDASSGRAEIESGGRLTPEQVRRFACDTKLVVILREGREILDVGRSTRTVSPGLRRALMARDAGCATPGCDEHRPRRLHAHHVIHWADGGPTCLQNLVMLCKAHHWAIHHNELTVSRTAATNVFRTPRGDVLEAVPRPPAVSPQSWARASSARQDQITTAAPAWQGDALALDYVLSTLLELRNLRRRERAVLERIAA